MKSYELKPTDENIYNTLIEDSILRNKDIMQFINILNAIDGNYSIALDGNWGSGKTFFVKQVKLVLDSFNELAESIDQNQRNVVLEKFSLLNQNEPTKLKTHICIYYDAWENDNDSDPIVSLIYTILSETNIKFTYSDEKNLIHLATSIFSSFYEKDISGILEKLNTDSSLDKLKTEKRIEEKVKELLESLLYEKGNRLVIFIDELDRCKPSYAVKLLERIKHYFLNDRITFVFSTNTKELQHTIKKYYGNEFNAHRYLDRFFDLRVSLDEVNLEKYFELLSYNSQYTYDIMCKEVIKNYRLELREIGRFLNIARIAYNPQNNKSYYFSEGKAMQFCLLYILPIILGLQIYNQTQYENFVNGKDSTPLFIFSTSLGERFFEGLLDENESYNEIEGMKFITVEEKLNSVYNFIFSDTNIEYSTKIGEYEFNKNMKKSLLQRARLLSDNIDLNRF